MPYEGQYANKSSHSDILKNQDVIKFLNECNFLKDKSNEEAQEMSACFEKIPEGSNEAPIPQWIFAFDGSYHESSIADRFPSTRIGFIKIGSILINMKTFNKLKEPQSNFVDPFKVAELKKDNTSATLVIPSANIVHKDCKSVQESFRYAIDEWFYDFRFKNDEPNTSLRTTLFYLFSLRRRYETITPYSTNTIILHKCPNPECDNENIIVKNSDQPQYCDKCHKRIYPTDCLRLWEEVNEFQTNTTAITRLMQILEHLLMVHYIRMLEINNTLNALGNAAFFIDGPLAIFGNAAWLHAAILKFTHHINKKLEAQNHLPLNIIGIIKSGMICEYFSTIEKFVKKEYIFAINDAYRYKYILQGTASSNGFGYETYYGQDFIYKSRSNRIFAFNLPYPFSSKNDVTNFSKSKTKLNLYKTLPQALKMIEQFQTDLFANAIVPTALAHEYTAISIMPGTKALNQLTKILLEE